MSSAAVPPIIAPASPTTAIAWVLAAHLIRLRTQVQFLTEQAVKACGTAVAKEYEASIVRLCEEYSRTLGDLESACLEIRLTGDFATSAAILAHATTAKGVAA